MVEMLKLLFLGVLLFVLASSVVFLALIVLCSLVDAGVKGCRYLSRWFSSRKTAL